MIAVAPKEATGHNFVALHDLTDLRISNVDKKSKADELPVVLCNYTDVYYNSTIRENFHFMEATATAREIEKCGLRPEDVVITKDSEQYDDIGVPAYVMDDVPDLVCGYHLAILRPDVSRLHGRYLFYALSTSSVQKQFHHFANGITRFGLRKADIGLVEIPLPSLLQQQAIASILGTLDDKIELNSRMNQTLESIAKAIFKDWFVDLGPVNAKAKSQEQYLPKEIWDIFPHGFYDDHVPNGWSTSVIGSEVRVVGGSTPSTNNASYWKGGSHSWTTPKDLSQLRSPVLLSTARKLTDAGVNKISSGILPIGTVLMSSRAPIGYFAIVEVPTAINQGFIGMVCEQRLPNIFVLNWCQQNLNHIKAISGGSTFGEISKKVFRPIPVIVPSEDLLAAFVRIVGPLYERIVVNLKENLLLCETRDLLLPKLISGKIRISDAEIAVDSVT